MIILSMSIQYSPGDGSEQGEHKNKESLQIYF